jgi:hypothetical protein
MGPQMMNKRTLWLTVLLAINIVLAVYLFNTRDADNRHPHDVLTLVENPVLTDVPLFDRDGETLSLRQRLDKLAPAMIVVFSPSDCPSCLDEKWLWIEAADRCHIDLIGIACSSDRDEFWKWVEITEIPFTVFLDTSYAVIDSLRPAITPMKLLVDRKGMLVWADPPRLDEHTAQKFMGDLEYAMSMYL